jgi:antitoxin component of MazEF toxin-antitoxin module
MIKTLTRQGNSSALIIDRTLMELLGIEQDTPLKITVEGRRMIVEPAEAAAPAAPVEPAAPAGPKSRAGRVKAAIEKTGRKNAELFRRLAK